MEKLAETRMGYNEVTFLSDRVCGICGFAHSTAYTTSVENAMGIVVPERAQMIRAILLEVERLHSHLLNLGLACHFTGFDSGFMQFFRVRETSMKMAEILTGARKTYGMNLIGGIRRDLLKEDMIQTRQLARRCAAMCRSWWICCSARRTWNSAPSVLAVWIQKSPATSVTSARWSRQRPRPRYSRRSPVRWLRSAADGSSQRAGLRRDFASRCVSTKFIPR